MHIRRHREIIFTVMGVILLFIMAGYTVYALRSLGSTLRKALGGIPGGEIGVRFELEALEPYFANGKLKRIANP